MKNYYLKLQKGKTGNEIVFCQDKNFITAINKCKRDITYTSIKASDLTKQQRLTAKEIPVPNYNIMYLVQNATCDMGLFSTWEQAKQYECCCKANLYYNEFIEGVVTTTAVLQVQLSNDRKPIIYKFEV